MSYYTFGGPPYSNELYHFGITGMKWGVRRYQNKDGSLTPAGREHYGVSNATKTQMKNAVKNAGRQVKNSVKSATSYAAKRTKMHHPEFMSDEELRTYTQRMIAEKNYSDLLRYQRANSGIGKAKAYVGDIVKRGGNILTDAAFRKIANKISKSRNERELENLQRENAIQALKDKFDDREIQRQVDQLALQNRANDLREQLDDATGSQAQKKELERLQRESQIADLRNRLDPDRLGQQRKIDDLTQQKTLRDLEKQLNSTNAGDTISAAMRIIGNAENYSPAEISKAQSVLKDYVTARGLIDKLPVNKQAPQANQNENPIPKAEPIPSANPNPAPIPPSYDMPTDYTPQARPDVNPQVDYGRQPMPTVEQMERVANPATRTGAQTRQIVYNPPIGSRDWLDPRNLDTVDPYWRYRGQRYQP